MTISWRLTNQLAVVLSGILLVVGLQGCSEKRGQDLRAPTDAQTYQKDQLALRLPLGWQVIEDFYPDVDRRRLNVVTPIGSSMTLDLFSAEQAPTLAEHFANYMAAILPPETENSSRIDSGDMSYGSIKGMFASVVLNEPYNVAMFIEVVPLRKDAKQAYFIFNTPPAQKSEISRHIKDIINTAQLP